jgi:hypothetical protein
MATTTVAAGVDLGGTKIQTVVLRDEEVVGSARVLTPQTGDPTDVIDAIVGTIRTSLKAGAFADADLGRIGIGTPGEIDARAGAVLLAANVPGFTDRVELGPRVSAAFEGVQVTVDNDVSVGVLGEHRRGAGRPFGNLLGVWVGTGVGGRAPRWEGHGWRDRPHGGEARRSPLHLRTPRLRRGLCREGQHGKAGTEAREAWPQDEPVSDHARARPSTPELGRVCEGPRAR